MFSVNSGRASLKSVDAVSGATRKGQGVPAGQRPSGDPGNESRLYGTWSSAYGNQPQNPLTWDQNTMNSYLVDPNTLNMPSEYIGDLAQRDEELRQQAGTWSAGDAFKSALRKYGPKVGAALVSSAVGMGAGAAETVPEMIGMAAGKKALGYGLSSFFSNQANKDRVEELSWRARGFTDQQIRDMRAARINNAIGDQTGMNDMRQRMTTASQSIGQALGFDVQVAEPESTAPEQVASEQRDTTGMVPTPNRTLFNFGVNRRVSGNPFAAQKARLVTGVRG